jgi:hypothetical protein
MGFFESRFSLCFIGEPLNQVRMRLLSAGIGSLMEEHDV